PARVLREPGGLLGTGRLRPWCGHLLCSSVLVRVSAAGQDVDVVATVVQSRPGVREVLPTLAAREPYPVSVVLGAVGSGVDVASGGPALRAERPADRQRLGRLAVRLVCHEVGPDAAVAVPADVLRADHRRVDRPDPHAAV